MGKYVPGKRGGQAAPPALLGERPLPHTPLAAGGALPGERPLPQTL